MSHQTLQFLQSKTCGVCSFYKIKSIDIGTKFKKLKNRREIY